MQVRAYMAHNVAAGFMRNIFTYCEALARHLDAYKGWIRVHHDFRKRYDASRCAAPRCSVLRSDSFRAGERKGKIPLEEQRGYTETPISLGSRAK